MDFDAVLQSTGPLGLFQAKVVGICYFAAIFPCLCVMLDVFANYLPDHRCRLPICDSEDSIYNENYLQYTIPYDKSRDAYEQCENFMLASNESFWSAGKHDDSVNDWYMSTLGSSADCPMDRFDRTVTEECQAGYVFDEEVFSSSSVIEYNLVCDKTFELTILNFAYMFGMLFGALLIGSIGDIFGRKIGMAVAVLIMSAGGLGCACSVSYWMLLASRFITGLGGNGLFQCAFIIAVEFVVPAHRVAVGVLINVPFAVGGVLLAVLGYLVNDNWRALAALSTTTSLVLLPFIWLLPESVRWLTSKDKDEAALKVIEDMAKLNKKPFPDHLLNKQPEIITVHSKAELLANEKPLAASTHGMAVHVTAIEEETENKSVFDLLRKPNMRKRCLVSFFIWASVTMSYYGLSGNAATLAGNAFVNFGLSNIIEIPSYFLAWFVLERIGRKGTMVLMLTVSGVACIIAGFLPTESSTLIVVFSLLGKFGAAACFATLYLYASEVFPTEYRSVGVGACSMCARIGGILAPISNTLGTNYYEPIPLLLFGILSLISACLTLFLPETVGCELPDTLEDSEVFGSDQSLLYFMCLKSTRTETESSVDVQTPSTRVEGAQNTERSQSRF